MLDVTDQPQTSESVQGPFAPLAEAMRHVRVAEQRLRDEQHAAWQRYLEDVEHILHDDLALEAEPEHLDAVAHRLVNTVKSHLDDLRVQAHLGTMEAEGLLDQLQRTLDQLAERVHLGRRH